MAAVEMVEAGDLLAQDGLEASCGVGNDYGLEVALRGSQGAGLVAMPRQLCRLCLQLRSLCCDQRLP